MMFQKFELTDNSSCRLSLVGNQGPFTPSSRREYSSESKRVGIGVVIGMRLIGSQLFALADQNFLFRKELKWVIVKDFGMGKYSWKSSS